MAFAQTKHTVELHVLWKIEEVAVLNDASDNTFVV